jgi:hypothetical protein
MLYEATVHNVFIASPGDVLAERIVARDVINEWNAVHAEAKRAILQPIRWETHSFPDMGDRAQGILNRQILMTPARRTPGAEKRRILALMQ